MPTQNLQFESFFLKPPQVRVVLWSVVESCAEDEFSTGPPQTTRGDDGKKPTELLGFGLWRPGAIHLQDFLKPNGTKRKHPPQEKKNLRKKTWQKLRSRVQLRFFCFGVSRFFFGVSRLVEVNQGRNPSRNPGLSIRLIFYWPTSGASNVET